MSETNPQPTAPNIKKVNNPAFDQMDAAKKAQAQGGEFVKLAAGESIVFHIDPSPEANKISIAQKDYKGDKNFRPIGVYKIFDVNQGKERTLELSMKWADELNVLLRAGFRTFTMTREGSGRDDTKYRFIPVQG